MYSASAMGAYLPPGDPTLTPRWLLMMAGGLFIGGLWLVYLAGRSTFTADEKQLCRRAGRQAGRRLRARLPGCRYLGGARAARCSQGWTGESIRSITSPRLPDMAGWRWLSSLCSERRLPASQNSRANWLGWAGATLALLIEITLVIFRDGGARPYPAEQGLRRVGSHRGDQLGRRRPVPGAVRGRTGRGRVADLRGGTRAKADGRSGCYELAYCSRRHRQSSPVTEEARRNQARAAHFSLRREPPGFAIRLHSAIPSIATWRRRKRWPRARPPSTKSR